MIHQRPSHGNWPGRVRRALALTFALASTGLLATVGEANAASTAPVGTPPPRVAGSHSLGPAPATTALSLDVVLKPRDPQALAAAAAAASTPGSATYRHYLARGQFASVYGPLPATIDSVVAALRAAGLRPGTVSANGLIVPVSTTVAGADSALGVKIQDFQLPDGRVAYANTVAALLPTSVAGDVQAVVGLDDLVTHVSHAIRATHSVHPLAVAQPRTSGPAPCQSATTTAADYSAYTGANLAQAYSLGSLYSAGDLGAGVTVAIYELEPFQSNDISTFQTCYGTNANVTTRTVDGGAGTGAGSGEAALDIENVIETAPAANIVVYEAPNTNAAALAEYSDMISDDTAKVISTSWGECEPGQSVATAQAENTIFEQAAVQGQTIFAAAGDTGAQDCLPNSNAANPLNLSDSAQAVAVNPSTGTAYVPLPTRDTLDVVNVPGNSLSNSGSALGSDPLGVAVDVNADRVYVTNNASNNVSVIAGNLCNKDVQENCAPIATIPVGSKPLGVATDSSTGTVYVANSSGPSISVISESSNSVVGTVTLAAGSEPDQVAVDAATNEIYVTNEKGSSVWALNGATCDASTQTGCATTPASVTVGSTPTGVAVNAASDTIYVANQGSDTMSVVSGASNTVTGTVNLSNDTRFQGLPVSVGVSSSGGQIFVSGSSFGVAVINASTLAIAATLANPTPGAGLAVDSQDGYVLVADHSADYLNMIPTFAAVDDPASQPFVTGVGGTDLSALGPPPTETVWNENPSGEGAGGGGVSTLWSMPAWQSAPGVINAQSSGAPCQAPSGDCREVPDVTASADPYHGYVIYFDGNWTAFGGTSGAAPLWAGLAALVDAPLVAADKPTVGFLNPQLYDLAGAGSPVFNDITSGNNDYTASNGGEYPATTGYDMASGLGSPIGSALATALEGTSKLALSTTTAPLPEGVVGTAYSGAVLATGGTAPYHYSITSGSLPAGLQIGATNGDITGTPTAVGSSTLVVGVSDSGSQSTSVTISIPVMATVAVGSDPVGVSINSAGTTAYVTNAASGTVSVINVASETVTHTITVGTYPLAVALNASGTQAYVSNYASGTVSVVNTSTDQVSYTINTGSGSNPEAFAVGSDGRVWVTLTGVGALAEFVPNSSGPAPTITELNLGGAPSGIAVSSDANHVYVANSTLDTLSIIDTTTTPWTVDNTVALGSGTFPANVALEGSTAYVAEPGADALGVVSGLPGSPVLTSVALALRPYGVAATASVVIATNSASGTATILNAATNPPALLGSAVVGSGAEGVAIGGSVAVIANELAGTVSLIPA